MVVPERNNCKRKRNQPSRPRSIHNLRHVQIGLGCMLPGFHRKRPLVSSGIQTAHKRSRAQSRLSFNQSLSQRPVQHHGLPWHGQYNSRVPCKKQRRNAFRPAHQPNSQAVAVVHSTRNSDHRSASTRQTQRCGRQRIKRVLRLQRMADPAIHKKVRCRPLCLASSSYPSNICQLETRSRVYLHRCNDPGLVPTKRLRLSSVCTNFSSSEEGISRQSRSGRSGSSVAGTALVASASEPSNQERCHDPELQTSAEGSCTSSKNPLNVPQHSFSRLSHIREQHQTEGFSEDITNILLLATRPSTYKTYQSP